MNQDIIHKYLKGEALEKEKLDILAWIELSAENRKQFMQYRRLYDTAIWNENTSSTSKSEYNSQKPKYFIALTKQLLKVASAVALIVACTLFIENKVKDATPVLSQTIEVPQGQYVNLILSDGTKVTLNSNSKLIFPTEFNKDSRIVELDGEGFFEVAHNANKPFYVHTSKCNVKVLGTEFNVLAYKNSTIFETSLVEGSVEVLHLNSQEKKLLKPNEKLELKGDQLFVSTMQNTDQLLWREGIYVFNDEPLEEIFAKLEQYYQIRFDVKDKDILSMKCTGKFRQKEGIDHVMKVLQKAGYFKYKRFEEKNTIRIQ